MQYENKIFFIWENDILPSFYNLYENAQTDRTNFIVLKEIWYDQFNIGKVFILL